MIKFFGNNLGNASEMYELKHRKNKNNFVLTNHNKNFALKNKITPQILIEDLSNTHNKRKIYIVSNIKSGGTHKYINDLIIKYQNIKIVFITHKNELVKKTFMPYDIILLQQLLDTDIYPEDLIEVAIKFKTKLILCLHDFCWLINDNNNYNNSFHNSYLKLTKIKKNSSLLFNNSSLIICNSTFTWNQYSLRFSNKNMVLEENNDISVDYTTKRVPLIKNNIINIANFQEFSECKGKENIESLMNKYKYYKGYKIHFSIVGHNMPKYKESNWHEYIESFNFHGLLHLNKWGETYSYALTKSINSGLPILYNNIGSFRFRIPKDVEHYIKVINYEKEYFNTEMLFTQFEKFLDYIIENNGLFDTANKNNEIVYKELYSYIFEDNCFCKKINNKIFNKVKPFAVYFPQFHSILENDINYYKDMTDITNLEYFNKTSTYKLDHPSLQELGLNTLLDYELTNKSIINKQIEIAKKYSIYGFACYYYWFSTNTMTNKNDVMEKCYNLFFEEDIEDFKIFFIWANENWTNNPAFNTKEQIINDYNYDNFGKNIDNLIKYFKHNNYYKIDNKPLFYIHHPFFMKEEELLMFKSLLENKCIENGFNGVILVLNNLTQSYNNFNNYNFHPNYKKTTTRDYNEYIDKHLNIDNDVNTVFFDFNNSARLCKPNKLHLVSAYKNNSIYIQDKYLRKVLHQYKNPNTSEFNKILLINSWNEWGENMAIEPGEKNGYKYLSLIKSNLLSFIAH